MIDQEIDRSKNVQVLLLSRKNCDHYSATVKNPEQNEERKVDGRKLTVLSSPFQEMHPKEMCPESARLFAKIRAEA